MRSSSRRFVAILGTLAVLAVFGISLFSLLGNRKTSDVVVGSKWNGKRFPSVAFVVTCQRSHTRTDDPILHPGKPGASHEHAFFGNTSTAAQSTVKSMQGARTTCDEPKDQAAYWTPSPAGDYLRAYYDAGAANFKTVSAFVAGGQGIAGDVSKVAPGIETVAFRCGAVADGPDASGWGQTPKTCGAGSATPVVRYTFGQCGQQRIKPCAAGEAARYVRLRLVMPWVDSMPGSTPGMGPHADFWNIWDQSRLEELVATCVRGERKSNIEIKQCRLNGVGPAHS